MAAKAEEAITEEVGTGPEGGPRYALVFATARWCEPAVPMRVIFNEVVRDLERRVVEARRRVALLVGENSPASEASPPAGSDSLLASAFSRIAGVRGVVLDVDEVDAVLASRADDAASGRPPDPAFELDPLISPAFAETIDFVPMIVLIREGNRPTEGEELARFAGQLPKLCIRERILEALGDDLLPPAA